MKSREARPTESCRSAGDLGSLRCFLREEGPEKGEEESGSQGSSWEWVEDLCLSQISREAWMRVHGGHL